MANDDLTLRIDGAPTRDEIVNLYVLRRDLMMPGLQYGYDLIASYPDAKPGTVFGMPTMPGPLGILLKVRR